MLYPRTGLVRFSHHQFPWVMTEDKRAGTGLTTGGLLEELADELGQCSYKKALISSEGFVFAVPPAEVKTYFGALFDEIRIVAYLRQPLRWMISDYNQGVKGWRGLTCRFDEHLGSALSMNNSPMDYYSKLSEWAAVFGWKNIMLRSFDKEKGDIIASFMSILGIDGVEDFDLPSRLDSNPRLSLEDLELTRVLNAMDLSPEDKTWLLELVRRSQLATALAEGQADSFACNIDNKLLAKIDKSNSRLLKYYSRDIFENDFFASLEGNGVYNGVEQLDAGNIEVIMRPFINALLERKNN